MHAQLGGHAHVFVLDVALDQRVLQLQRRHRLVPAPLGDRLRPRRVPRGHVGQAHVAHLAAAHQVVHRAHHLLGGRDLVPGVHVVHVEVVGAEALQRALHRAQQVLAAVAAAVGIAVPEVERVLAGEHHLVTGLRVADELAEPGLAGAVRVDIGRVDEVAAARDVRVEDAAGRLLVRPPAPFGAEGHRAERQAAHAQAGAAEGVVRGAGGGHRRLRVGWDDVTVGTGFPSINAHNLHEL